MLPREPPKSNRFAADRKQVMRLRVSVIALLILLVDPLLPGAFAAGSQEQEYQQVRTIALRDPKVRAAYEDADRRLEAKILQIDPALASYVHTRREGQTVGAAPTERAGHVKLTSFAGAAAQSRSHVVAKGETLSGIASKYGVSVATLKSANHISDDRKLSVGVTLAIPVIPAKAGAKQKILE
jgi:LysM domain